MAAYEKRGESDEWYTPKYIFDALGVHFDLDVAAPPDGPRHVPASRWYSIIDDALSCEWSGLVWMNPPFGHQKEKCQWLSKFFDHGQGIALMPDRTSAPWFQNYAPMAEMLCWVAPKIKFERADGSLGKSPGTGTVLMACGYQAVQALMYSGLGFLTRPIPRI